jgi:hypothetical protein
MGIESGAERPFFKARSSIPPAAAPTQKMTTNKKMMAPLICIGFAPYELVAHSASFLKL